MRPTRTVSVSRQAFIGMIQPQSQAASAWLDGPAILTRDAGDAALDLGD
jgi:hypothetical protein